MAKTCTGVRPIFGSTNSCFKPTAAYSTSGHAASHYIRFPQRGGASQKGMWILTSKVLSQVLEILLNLLKCFESRLPRNLNKNQESLKVFKNNNSQQHKDDTIPCAQATLTVCDCMKHLGFPRFAQPGQSKLRIHQSFHKLIQFVKDLEIFDRAKLLTNGTFTMPKNKKLDDGWPESVEEQSLLLLVWRHYITR